jgi:hypothetical protein
MRDRDARENETAKADVIIGIPLILKVILIL